MLRPLERDDERPRGCAGELGDLPVDRVADHLAEDAAHQLSGDPALFGQRHDCVEHSPLATDVADRGGGERLGSSDVRDDLEATGDQLDELPVDPVELVAEAGQVAGGVHRSSLADRRPPVRARDPAPSC